MYGPLLNEILLTLSQPFSRRDETKLKTRTPHERDLYKLDQCAEAEIGTS